MTECAWCGVVIDHEKMDKTCADDSGAEFCSPACKGFWEISDLLRAIIEDIRRTGSKFGVEYD